MNTGLIDWLQLDSRLQKRRLVRHLSLAAISGLLVATLYYAFGYSTEMWVDSQSQRRKAKPGG
jgi:hypothetical protein